MTSRVPAVVLGDLSLIRPLVAAGIPVIVGVKDPQDPCVRSRHVDSWFVLPGFRRAERARSATLLAELGARLADTHGTTLPLFYGDDGQLAMLYEHRPALEECFRFVNNREELGWAMLDKQRFAGACTAAGVKAPRTWTDDMPLEALREMRAPLLVKPKLKSDWQKLKLAFFRGGAKAMRFESAGDLLDHPAFELVRDSVVVQELIESPVAALSSFHGFADASGRLLASFCGRKVRTSPAFAGESAVIELVRDDEVERAGRDTVARLGVVGPFKVDLVRDPRTGELFTLEVNARFNLWHHLGAAHGVNLPAIAYHHLVEGRDEAPLDEVVPRARWVSFYGCYRALRDEGRGPVGALARWAATALRSSVVHDVLDWRDPAPFLWYVRSLARPRRRGPAVVAAAAPL